MKRKRNLKKRVYLTRVVRKKNKKKSKLFFFTVDKLNVSQDLHKPLRFVLYKIFF